MRIWKKNEKGKSAETLLSVINQNLADVVTGQKEAGACPA